MPRPIQDVIPPERKTIRHIPVPDRSMIRKTHKPAESRSKGAGFSKHSRNSLVMISYSQISLWFLAVVTVIILAFSISVFFTSAKIVVTPRQLTIPIDLLVVSKRLAGADELSFEVINLSDEAADTVSATGEQYVERKASGKILIYNNYSGSAQRLIKNTRFETPEGLIYRINQSITVPGRRNDGGSLAPGNVEVMVYADQSGPRHNIGLTDFTIPGFKSDSDRFKNFYARSKTPMTGGFAGMEKFVSPDVLKMAQGKLRETLGGNIVPLAKTKIPDDFWLPDGAVFTVFESLPQTEIPGNKIKIRERASSTAVIFNKEKLAKFLASKVVPDYRGDPITITNPNELSVDISEKAKVKPLEAAVIVFSVKGSPKFVWSYDEGALRSAVLGKLKRETDGILKTFAGIERTEVVIRPFWKKSFPDKPSRITVETHSSAMMPGE